MANKSYRVTVKARNANLLRAIERAGYVAGGKFADLVGIKYNDLNDLVNMKSKPIDMRGDLKPFVEKICVFLNKMPSELFNFDQMHNALEQNAVDVDVDSSAAAALLGRTSSIEVQQCVDAVMSTLTDREQTVLRLRYGIEGDEMTFGGIANELGLSLERVRQIEGKALRKLRHPTRSDALKKIVEVV